MATGLVTLGAAALGPGGAAGDSSAPAMSAPQNTEQQTNVTFGGAQKGDKGMTIDPTTALLIAAGMVGAVVVYLSLIHI